MRQNYKYKIIAFSLCILIILTSCMPIQASTVTVNNTKYGYTQLNKAEKKVYKQILQAIKEQKSEIIFKKYKDYDRLSEIYSIVDADNPDIFWVKTVTRGSVTKGKKVLKTYMKFKYTMNITKRKSKQKELVEKTKEILKDMPVDSEYEKAKYIYEKVAETVKYDYKKKNKNNQNILSAMLDGNSVCAGYTKMYTYLLQQAGIRAMYIHGKTDKSNHAWTLVRIDNKYYYSDVTWGDIESIKGYDIDSYIDYSYFLEPEDYFLKNHTLGNNYVKLPKCNSIDNEYFHVEDLYLTKFTKTERELVQEIIDSGVKVFQLRGNISSIVMAIRDYAYTLPNIYGLSIDEERNVITVFVE